MSRAYHLIWAMVLFRRAARYRAAAVTLEEQARALRLKGLVPYVRIAKDIRDDYLLAAYDHQRAAR